MLSNPIHINHIELSNRLVMPPMATEKSEGQGLVSDSLCAYYDEKSKGGYIGLIITEHSYILPEGKASKAQLSVADDTVIPGLQRLAHTVHKNGSKIIAQINHAGGAAKNEITGLEVLSPSLLPMPRRNTFPDRAMTDKDITRIIEAFSSAAVRIKKAGFDGVEIHSAHGYLLNQFYSPLTNRREDAYTGKNLDGRIKLHLEVISAVRAAVGNDFPIALRLGACDYTVGGSTIEDSIRAAKAFENAGIDLLDISGGFCGYTNPNSSEQGYFAEITMAIKKEISIPVILTGGITDAAIAEKLLQEKKADLIGVGRAILRDSHWAEAAIIQ